MRSLVVMCVMVALSQAQVLPGECPEFVPKEDFDVEQYLGKWYEIMRVETRYELNQVCNYAEYTDRGDGTVGVHNAGLEADGTMTEIFGYVEPSDVSGALLLHLDGVPFVGDYNVLETDYVTYTSVFSCGPVPLLGHVEQAWILARKPSLTEDELNTALSAFAKWGINTEKYHVTDQEGCD